MPSDYQRIATAIEHLGARYSDPPSLDEIAAHVGLRSSHFHRLFRQMTGVSPKRFCQTLAGDAVEETLRAGESVLQATQAAGLSSPSRTHELMLNLRGMTPGEFSCGGAALTLRYGTHPTPLGDCLVVLTERGVCELRFLDGDEDVPATLRRQWPNATISERPADTAPVAKRLFAASSQPGALSLHVRGTNFQLRVWSALLAIPPGSTSSYRALATTVCGPDAARAVGNAVGRNPVAVLIPCHRVLRANGALGGYRWGTSRKRSLLALDGAERSPSLWVMSDAPQPKHHAIDYIEITVTNLTEAKRFYATAFDWEFTDYGPEYAGIRRPEGGEAGGLCVADRVTRGGPLVVLYSDDLETTRHRVREAGSPRVEEPFDFPGGRRFHFEDPSGNELAVWTRS